jgi:hypothetical protein
MLPTLLCVALVAGLPANVLAAALSSPSAAPAGAAIILRVEFPSDWPWDEIPWQDLWTVVQWRDVTGIWRHVDGWQGGLDHVAVAEDGKATGAKTWWVGSGDLGRGPFRWLVTRGEARTLVAESSAFYLPDLFAERAVAVVLPPEPPLPCDAAITPDGASTRTGFGVVHDIAYYPDGQSVALATDRGVYVCRADLSAQVLARPGGSAASVAVSPEGDLYLAAREVPLLGIDLVAFSPDGDTMALAEDGVVTLVDVATGEATFAVEGQVSLASLPLVAFSPDGATLATLETETWCCGTWRQAPAFAP